MSNETFTLNRDRCTLANLNLRAERHGDESEPAIDIKFEFDSANNLLSKLNQDLRVAFYRKDDNRDLIDGDHLPALRFPQMGSISWELEVPRTVLRIHQDDVADIVLKGGKTNKFKLEFLEGGTVNWTFRCQFSKPDEHATARLMGFLNQPVIVSLHSEAEEVEGDLFEQAEQQAKEPMSEARQAAEKMFDDGGLGLPVEDLVVPE